MENFFSDLVKQPTPTQTPAAALRERHLHKVVEWFYPLLMKRPPWVTWTNDIYDAMRCIDHLPIG